MTLPVVGEIAFDIRNGLSPANQYITLWLYDKILEKIIVEKYVVSRPDP